MKGVKYKITIQTLTTENQEEQKYPRSETVYEQVVEILDISRVIEAVNPKPLGSM